ncbi:hypothetical protein LWI29_017436 [Acer saccharum]|uniref:Uncharacterized protein n=1 Tax=Acer saccharum TaxID=4024 RepID=A0AA39W1V9_ACESA|nr:hypothetical protein LWI29_017436 [Acer saccharum]
MSVLKVQKVSAPKEKEPPALSDADVVEAFRRYCPGRGLSSLSLIPALDVAARGPLSVAEVWLQVLPGFGAIGCLISGGVAPCSDAEAQLKQIEHAMVHLSTEKLKADETQAAMAGQVVLWKHELEKEVIRSTRLTHERNELKKQLAAKEKEMVGQSTNSFKKFSAFF